MKTLIQKTATLQDPVADEFADQVARGHVRFLGYLDSDPDTTGWGTPEVTAWFTKSGGAFALKFWDGTAVKTVTTT